MRVIFILALVGVSFFEVIQAVKMAQKWNNYKSRSVVNKDACPPNSVVVRTVEHNPINDMNIDSFMQVYGITQENIHQQPVRKEIKKKSEILIEPKKIIPEPPKFKIKINKAN